MNSGAMFFFHDVQMWFQTHKNVVYISMGALLAVLVAGGFVWKQRQEKYNAAYVALTQAYDELLQAYENSELWEDVELAGKSGAESFSSTELAPYFEAVEAEALIQRGQLDEAIAKINSTIHRLSSSNSLYYPFKIKYAQMKMSHENPETVQEGLKLLQQLAEDSKNPQQDEALFYVGYYYWLNNDRAMALKYWQMLRNLFGDAQTAASPWVQVIQDFALDME